MEVIWSDLALRQLDAVVDYVEENFGVMTARKSLRKILEKTEDSHFCHATMFVVMKMVRTLSFLSMLPKVKE